MSDLNNLSSAQPVLSPHAKLSMLLLIVAALGSLYLPTSVNGTIINSLVPWYTLGLCTVLVTYAAMNGLIRSNMYYGFLVMGLLAFFTVLSPLPNFAFGAMFPYLGFCAVLVLDLRSIPFAYRKFALLIVCLPMLIFGWSTVLGFDEITSVQEGWYQISNEDLWASMIEWYAKPVSVFGTHSVAAFCYFALCVLMLRFGKHAPNRSERVLGYLLFFSFAALIPLLLSTSAFALFGLLIMLLVWNVLRRLGWRTNTLLAFFVAGIFGYLLISGYFGVDIFSDDVLDVFRSSDNGFAGRFAKGSRLEPTYSYLFKNYFQPVGFTYDGIIAFGDGFIAEYVLRSSILGYIFVLLMLKNFLKRNLYESKHFLLFFGFFLLSDFGYPLLTTYRVAFVIPLYIALWRSVRPAAGGSNVEKIVTC